MEWGIAEILLWSAVGEAGHAKGGSEGNAEGRDGTPGLQDHGLRDEGGTGEREWRMPSGSTQAPPMRHREGNAEGRMQNEEFCQATPRLHQSHIKAPTRRVDSHLIGTPKPPQGYPKAPLKPSQGSTKAPSRLLSCHRRAASLRVFPSLLFAGPPVLTVRAWQMPRFQPYMALASICPTSHGL